jgi:hypothetical protein
MIEAVAIPSMADPPFAVAPDIVLDLPPPPSVNRTRRVDWSAIRGVKAWQNVANAYVLAAKGRAISPLRLAKISAVRTAGGPLRASLQDRSRQRAQGADRLSCAGSN